MKEIILDSNQSNDEREGILKELGPTIYDVTEVTGDVEEMKKYAENQHIYISNLMEKTEDSDLREHYKNCIILLNRALEAEDKDIIISSVVMYKIAIVRHKMNDLKRGLRTQTYSSEEKNGIEREIDELKEQEDMLHKISTKERRDECDAEIEQRINEIIERRKQEENSRVEEESLDESAELENGSNEISEEVEKILDRLFARTKRDGANTENRSAEISEEIEEILSGLSNQVEREEILKELGPTIYDIVGYTEDVDELREYIENQIKYIEELLEKPERQHKRIFYQKCIELLKNGLDVGNKKELFSAAQMYKRGWVRDVYNNLRNMLDRCTVSEDREKIVRIKDEVKELEEMLYKISTPEGRDEYNAELKQKINEIIERRKKEEAVRLENEKKEKLKRDRMARREASREIVIDELGQSFNPDKSRYKVSDRALEQESPESPLFKWQVILYPEKKLFFETQTDNKKYPELNQKVSVYRYGTFEYQTMFKNSGNPTIEDKTCEIIGVRKVDIEGNEEETFLIAQTIETAYMKKMTMREIMELEKEGVEFSITESADEIRYRERLAKRKQEREAKSGSFGKLLQKMKNKINPEPEKPKRVDLDEEKDVLIYKKKLVELTPREKERLTRIYLSDYLIDNAVRNNSRYIGSLQDPTSDLNMDIIRAASYAEKKPGTVVEGICSFLTTYERSVSSLQDVIDMIRIREKMRTDAANSRTSKPKEKKAEIRTLDD